MRLEKDQPLDHETFAFGSTVPLTYIDDDGKQVEVLVKVVIYWFVASEESWYIKFSLPSDFGKGLRHGFYEDSFIVHKGKTWAIDHGRHELHHFEKWVYRAS